MKLTILGSGTYQPELERHSSAYLIEVGKSKICFDFGRGAVDQLLKVGVAITQIEAIFISHWHPDHVSDLLSILHYSNAPLPDELAILSKPRVKPLKIYGPKGTKNSISHLFDALMADMKQNIEVIELGQDEVKDNEYRVKSFPTIHNPDIDVLCFRIEADNKVLAYSGDSVESEGLNQAIKDADLAVIEASWPERVNPTTHLTGQRAGKIAAEENVKKLVLTHIAPYYLKGFNPQKDAAEYFKGEVILARDLLKIEI